MRRTRNVLSTVALTTSIAFAAGGLRDCEDRGFSAGTKTERHDQSYQRKASRIEVKLDSGDLRLTTGDAGEVTVERQLRWENRKPTVHEDWSGNTLRITATCPDDKNCTVDYSLSVPAAVSVKAYTESGNLSIEDVTGRLDLGNQSGDVTVTNAAGNVRIRGESGRITGNRLRSAQVDAKTTSGDITFRFAAAPGSVKGVTDSGDIRIVVPRSGNGQDGYRVQADTNDGHRDIGVESDAGGRRSIVADVNDGDVAVSYG